VIGEGKGANYERGEKPLSGKLTPGWYNKYTIRIVVLWIALISLPHIRFKFV